MNDEQRKTKPPTPWEVLQKALPIIGLVVLVLGLCWLLASTGKLTTEAVTAILVAAGGILLIRRNGKGGSAAAALLAFGTFGAASCATPCLAERTSVNLTRAVVELADEGVGEDAGEEWDEVMSYTRGSLDLGEAAVAACEAGRDDSSWLRWVEVAVKGVSGIMALIGAAGVDIPDYLLELIRAAGEALGGA